MNELRKAYDEGYSDGYDAALDASGQRLPLIITLVAVAIIFGLGWAAGHYG